MTNVLLNELANSDEPFYLFNTAERSPLASRNNNGDENLFCLLNLHIIETFIS
uniref:Uncharacterized protein n=1 Tax=Rhizophagus irregularis (strain DAOM 181602 / DAOM 197198 / MUCL 43194) TaxID=747089 RepID=U9SZD1_RHIID